MSAEIVFEFRFSIPSECFMQEMTQLPIFRMVPLKTFTFNVILKQTHEILLSPPVAVKVRHWYLVD